MNSDLYSGVVSEDTKINPGFFGKIGGWFKNRNFQKTEDVMSRIEKKAFQKRQQSIEMKVAQAQALEMAEAEKLRSAEEAMMRVNLSR